MALNTRIMSLVIHLALCSLLGFSSFCDSTATDIACLKAIKHSFADPRNHLQSSWNFNNNTGDYICYFSGVDCWHNDENRVLNLNLANMGLKGSFPISIENCTSLTGLNLSGNQLSGKIPSDLSKKIPFISVLDLSHNNFSGEIPLDIANCTYLNVLKLNNNRLTGQIPALIGFLDRLNLFSVANNLLSGRVPSLMKFTAGADSYANNDGLCGGPLGPCLSPAPDMFSVQFVSGFFVGYVVAVALVIVSFVLFSKTKFSEKKVIKKKLKKPTPIPTVDARRMDIKISSLERLVTRISFNEISEVTLNFKKENIIGSGNMGTMYKATLPNGWFLAIKRLYDSKNFKKQFLRELMTLGRLRHTNLVPLLGFCIEKKETLLIYKYISNGTLYNWLHNTKIGNSKTAIDWSLRVKVAIGLARGLAWLHYNPNIQVVHLNLTSKCILLDQKFEPKMSNFSGAMFLNPNETQSTRGFIVNREFWEVGFVKKDVHNFGMVLIELITGKDPDRILSSFGMFNGIGADLSSSSSGFYEAIDKGIVGIGHDGEIFQVLRIACDCVQKPEQRPTMLQVYKNLRTIGERYGLRDDSDDMLSQTEIAMFRLGLK